MMRYLAQSVAFFIFLAAGVGGVFASAGFCVVIWGTSILDTALANPPNRSHPAFFTFIALMPVCMLIGFTGAFVLFFAPVIAFFGYGPSSQNSVGHMRALCAWFIRKTD